LGNLLGKFLVKELPLLVNSLVKDGKKAIKKRSAEALPILCIECINFAFDFDLTK